MRFVFGRALFRNLDPQLIEKLEGRANDNDDGNNAQVSTHRSGQLQKLPTAATVSYPTTDDMHRVADVATIVVGTTTPHRVSPASPQQRSAKGSTSTKRSTRNDRSNGDGRGRSKPTGSDRRQDEAAGRAQANAKTSAIGGGGGSAIHVRFPAPTDGVPVVTYDNGNGVTTHTAGPDLFVRKPLVLLTQ